MTEPDLATPTEERSQRAMGLVLAALSLVAAVALLWVWLDDNGLLRGGSGIGVESGSGEEYDPWAVPAKPKERAEFKDVTDCGDMLTRARVCSTDFDVDATFEHVSADEKGQLVIPTHADHPAVGWFQDTAPVGSSSGNSVLAGHVDYPWDNPTLAALKTAKPGQKLWVSDGNGNVFSYTVTTVREPTPRTSVPSDLFVQDGPASLSMVTCTGEYVQIEGTTDWTYTHNLIVDFALDPELAPAP